jgi:hypothetical protein
MTSMAARLSCAGRGLRSEGHKVALPTWRAAQVEDCLGRWAMSLMLINVSTKPRPVHRPQPALRKLKRAARLPKGDEQA